MAIFLQHIPVIVMQQPGYIVFYDRDTARNRPATEPVTLKVYNIKLSFDIWLVLYLQTVLLTDTPIKV